MPRKERLRCFYLCCQVVALVAVITQELCFIVAKSDCDTKAGFLCFASDKAHLGHDSLMKKKITFFSKTFFICFSHVQIIYYNNKLIWCGSQRVKTPLMQCDIS